VELPDELLVHVRAPRELGLQLLVDEKVPLQLPVTVRQLRVAIEELLRLPRLEVQLCGHLLVLHDGALRRRVELIPRLQPVSYPGLADLLEHLLLQGINLHCLLPVQVRPVIYMFLRLGS